MGNSFAPWAISSLARRKAASQALPGGSRSACPRSTSSSPCSSKAWESACSQPSVRGLALTGSGQAYLETCRPLLAELLIVDDTLRRSAQRLTGTLVIAAHSQLVVAPCRCPSCRDSTRAIPISRSTSGSSTALPTRTPSPRMSSFSTAGPKRTTSSIASWVTIRERWLSAHPTTGPRAHPGTPARARRHACVLVRNPAGIVIDLWEFARGDEKASVKVNGWLCSTGREVVLDAVLAEKGIARLKHEPTTRAHLQAGRLVPVLPEWEVQGGPPINLLFRPSQRRTPRVRVFLDFVTGRLRHIEAEAQAKAGAAALASNRLRTCLFRAQDTTDRGGGSLEVTLAAPGRNAARARANVGVEGVAGRRVGPSPARRRAGTHRERSRRRARPRADRGVPRLGRRSSRARSCRQARSTVHEACRALASSSRS